MSANGATKQRQTARSNFDAAARRRAEREDLPEFEHSFSGVFGYEDARSTKRTLFVVPLAPVPSDTWPVDEEGFTRSPKTNAKHVSAMQSRDLKLAVHNITKLLEVAEEPLTFFGLCDIAFHSQRTIALALGTLNARGRLVVEYVRSKGARQEEMLFSLKPSQGGKRWH